MSHFEKVVIRASAGSGKTFQLSNRYIRLLFDEVPVDQILAVTFTRMAAGEIRDRIFSRLGKAALSEAQTQALIREVYGNNAENLPKIACEDVVRVLQSLIQNLHRLRISTLDSFGNQIAKSFSLELGLPVDWDIGEDVDEKQMRASAVLMTLRLMKANVALRLMNMLSKGAASKRIADELHATVQDMIAYVRNSSLNAWTKLPHYPIPDLSVLPDLIERLRHAPIPWTKPKNKKDEGHPNMARYGTPRNRLVEALCADDIQETLANSLVRGIRNNDAEKNGTLGELATTVLEITKIMEPRALNLLADQTGALYPIVSRVAAFMDELKYASGLYQFDDVTRLLARWVVGAKDSGDSQSRQLVFRLDAMTKHLFLDEFQDTSQEQWKFIRPFVEGILANSNGTSFFCVGDVKQAIYGWRNGLVEIFNRVEQLVNDHASRLSGAQSDSSVGPATAGPATSLVVNWRSCKAVIDVVNKLFGSLNTNDALIGVTDSNDEFDIRKMRAAIAAADHWSLGFEEHKTAPRNDEQNGLVTLEVAPLYENDPDRMREVLSELDPKGMLAGSEEDDSGIVSSRSGPKLLTLATAVARIRQICRDIPNASIGVVTRTNRTLGIIATALRGYGIEVSEEGGSPLDNVASVRTLLAALTLADHPGDTTALYQVASVVPLADYFGISSCPLQSDEKRIITLAENENAKCVCWNEHKTAALRISSFLRERIAASGLGSVVAELAHVLIPHCNEREAERLDRVCELGWTVGALPRVDSFISLIRSKKREFSRSAAVQALTIHKSKGLEFDVVVLPDLFEEFFDIKTSAYIGRDGDSLDVDTVLVYVNKELQYLLPDSPVDFKQLVQNQWQTDMEESLCNLYVAITRAKYQLTMIVPSQKDDKYTSRTYANIVRSGLDVLTGNANTQGDIAYSHGDPHWWKHVSFAPRSAQADPVATARRKELVNIASVATSSGRNLYLSPSQDSSLKWSNPLSYIRGTALHRCFQEIRWLDEHGLPDEKVLIDALEQLPGPKVDPTMIIAEFKAQCEKPEIREALSLAPLQDTRTSESSPIGCGRATKSAEWDVFAERAFSFTRRDGHLARGIIDRLVLLRDAGRVVGAEILDYKSDRLEDCDSHDTILEKHALLFEKYFGQLREYEKVVRRWYHLRPEMIAKKLLFVSSGIVVPVPPTTEV